MYIIGGVAAAIIVILLICWYAGYFSGEGKKAETNTSTNLSDKKIGTLEMDKAFEAMKAFKNNFDETIFKELTHSLKSFSSASDETLKKFVELTVETTDEEQKKKDITEKTEKVKANIKKINDEFFGATDKYNTYIQKLYDITFEKKEDKFSVVIDSDGLDMLKKYEPFITANVTANPSKLSEEAKKAITEEKYLLTGEQKTSAMKIMGIKFMKFILE